MCKKKVLVAALAFACLAAALAAGAPKVAVLDAVLPERMDTNVAIGVTEKISEELVSSGRFTVLDRTTVGQSLKEIEFQMSGMVSDEQIRRAGEQLNSRLGAAYVVVARVSQVGDTFFVTAKMIDIKTGEITAQASSEQEGKLAITLKIAQVVGKKLAGGIKEPAEDIQTELAEETKPPAEPAPAAPAPARAAPPQKRLRSRISVFGSYAVFAGTSEEIILGTYPLATFAAYGGTLHWLQFLWKGLYADLFVDYLDEEVDYGITEGVQQILGGQVGVGWGIPIGSRMQLALGIHGGYTGATAGSYWTDEGTTYEGIGVGAEANLDWFLGKHLAVGVRLDYTVAVIQVTSGTLDESYLSVMVGAGYAF